MIGKLKNLEQHAKDLLEVFDILRDFDIKAQPREVRVQSREGKILGLLTYKPRN